MLFIFEATNDQFLAGPDMDRELGTKWVGADSVHLWTSRKVIRNDHGRVTHYVTDAGAVSAETGGLSDAKPEHESTLWYHEQELNRTMGQMIQAAGLLQSGRLTSDQRLAVLRSLTGSNSDLISTSVIQPVLDEFDGRALNFAEETQLRKACGRVLLDLHNQLDRCLKLDDANSLVVLREEEE